MISYTAAVKRSTPMQRIHVYLVTVMFLALPILLVLGLMAFWSGSLPLLLLALLAPFVVAAFLYKKSQNRLAVVLASLEAQPSSFEEYPRYHNLVESLSLEVGVAEPTCYILHEDSINGIALSENQQNVVIITTGALNNFGLAEAEGFIAELLVRLSNGHADDSTFAYALFGLQLVDKDRSAVLKRYATWAVETVIGDSDRELLADRDTKLLTSYPPGLKSAFEKALTVGFVPAAATQGNDYLWVVPPSTQGSIQTTKNVKSGLGLRVDLLANDI